MTERRSFKSWCELMARYGLAERVRWYRIIRIWPNVGIVLFRDSKKPGS